MLQKGLVQIYTGDGKGKTTAAIGLAVRAAGQGCRVLFCQFLKPPSLKLGERVALQEIPNIQIKLLEQSWNMEKSPQDESGLTQVRRAVADALAELTAAAAKRTHDLFILDEIVFCYARSLAAIQDIAALVENRNPHVEIVLTGRGADEPLIQLADLVTEMKQIKHPFERGIAARAGIEY